MLMVKKKGYQSSLLEFSVSRYSYLSEPIKRLVRKKRRLRLLVLLHLRRSPDVLPSLLSTPVETMTGPS